MSLYKNINGEDILCTEEEEDQIRASWEQGARETSSELIKKQIETELLNLSSTDWCVIKASETGSSIPNDIRLSRQASRDKITELRKQL